MKKSTKVFLGVVAAALAIKVIKQKQERRNSRNTYYENPIDTSPEGVYAREIDKVKYPSFSLISCAILTLAGSFFIQSEILLDLLFFILMGLALERLMNEYLNEIIDYRSMEKIFVLDEFKLVDKLICKEKIFSIRNILKVGVNATVFIFSLLIIGIYLEFYFMGKWYLIPDKFMNLIFTVFYLFLYGAFCWKMYDIYSYAKNRLKIEKDEILGEFISDDISSYNLKEILSKRVRAEEEAKKSQKSQSQKEKNYPFCLVES